VGRLELVIQINLTGL